MDDLPIWGIGGEIDDSKENFYIWTHKKFEIGYNGDQIVDVNLTSDGRTKLQLGESLEFTYEVIWKKSDVKFEDRFDKYLDPNFFQHRIHWFSIFNSFMMVIFLVGLVTMILMRTLRKDYARYSKEDDVDDMSVTLETSMGGSRCTAMYSALPPAPSFSLPWLVPGLSCALLCSSSSCSPSSVSSTQRGGPSSPQPSS